MQNSRDGVGWTRRTLATALSAALAVCALGTVLSGTLGALDLAPACGPGSDLVRMPDGSRACQHADEAPPGVDVTDPVSTAELRRRPGAGPAAIAAAAEQGVPTAVATTATSPDVTCDGNGTSGYRVQPMYVVEAGKANRFAALEPSFQKWAAGVDDVFNRSAAVTGGVRKIRYVTEPGANDTCVADVLNVTVPSGSMASFNATVQAVQNLGYTDPTRKYLMWTDATSLCGVASMYLSDSASQGNTNNGAAPQYARVDSGCWGGGDGAFGHSVEAHELVHTLGGVQNSAPHSTNAGHCWDEADTMCYADGGDHAMVNVCAGDKEYLLDCNSDDYYSTYPDPGSYLSSHWNAADSRFLIGGGNGTGGGSAGAPSVLGATLAVNNPAVPGLSTQATVTPALPTGRTVSSVAWTSARRDCSFDEPTEVQTRVSCAATSAKPTTVTVTVTDSSGATKKVTSPLTFATGSPRAVTASLSVAGQDSTDVDTASACLKAGTPVSAVLTDTATGAAIKGLKATFTKQADGAAKASSAGSASSGADGRATVTATMAAATTFRASTQAGATYAAASPVELPATVAQCSPELTAEADTLSTYTGGPVTVTGELTRTVDGEDVAVAGAGLVVSSTGARTTRLGSVKTGLDGSFSVVVRPLTAGALSVSLAGSTSYVATSAALGDLTVQQPTSTLEAEVDRTSVGYGGSVVVTGTVQRVVGGSASGAAGQTVTAKLAAAGKSPARVGSARTDADGTFEITAPLKASGALTVEVAKTVSLPAASASLGDVTVGLWSTSLTATQSAMSVQAGKQVTVSGKLTRSYGGESEDGKKLPVKLYSRASGASKDSVAGVTTGKTDGTYAFKLKPRATTTYVVKVVGLAGHQDTASSTLAVTVP